MYGVSHSHSPPQHRTREIIRDLLSSSERFQALDSDTRREIARGLVRISSTAQALAAEVETAESVLPKQAGLALEQSAESAFSGVAAQRVAGTTQQILNAVSFPRFVTESINGVFKALLDSNQQQLEGYVDLIRNVSESVLGFADANVGVENTRRWLEQRFPESFTTEAEPDPFGESGEEVTEQRLRLRPEASMPAENRLRSALGLGPRESMPRGDPERLIPLARLALARNRQQMLATLVMLGMQRIVIESGRLHAAMRFHIDTRSAAAVDRGSRFDLRNQIRARGNLRLGPWGIDTEMQNTIGYVSTQRTQTTEEMNTDLELSSSVELVFKTDYLPLERLAGGGTQDRIRVNTLNPNEELRRATQERRARRDAQGRGEEARRRGINLGPGLSPSPSSGGAAATRQGTEAASPSRSRTASPRTPSSDRRTPAPTETQPARTPASDRRTRAPAGNPRPSAPSGGQPAQAPAG